MGERGGRQGREALDWPDLHNGFGVLLVLYCHLEHLAVLCPHQHLVSPPAHTAYHQTWGEGREGRREREREWERGKGRKGGEV